MTGVAPPVIYPKPRLIPVTRVDVFAAPVNKPSGAPAFQAGQANAEHAVAEPAPPLTPDRLVVRIDVDAGRFVQTLSDAQTQQTIWRYPSETQLAFSRAVKAYLRALSPA